MPTTPDRQNHDHGVYRAEHDIHPAIHCCSNEMMLLCPRWKSAVKQTFVIVLRENHSESRTHPLIAKETVLLACNASMATNGRRQRCS